MRNASRDVNCATRNGLLAGLSVAQTSSNVSCGPSSHVVICRKNRNNERSGEARCRAYIRRKFELRIKSDLSNDGCWQSRLAPRALILKTVPVRRGRICRGLAATRDRSPALTDTNLFARESL